MPNLRSTVVLAVVSFLLIFIANELPKAQALTLAPTLSAAAEDNSGTAEDPNNIYDTTNPDYPTLQKTNETLADIAIDKKGKVDWMKVLESGVIAPRADLQGAGKMEILETDIIMRNTKGMPYVKFPHGAHTRWLACANCHDQIFTPKAGANTVSMTKIFRGQYCGVCHGKVAFAPNVSCERCHSIPFGNIKPWW